MVASTENPPKLPLCPSPLDIDARRIKHQLSMLKIELERAQSQLEAERLKYEQAMAANDYRIMVPILL